MDKLGFPDEFYLVPFPAIGTVWLEPLWNQRFFSGYLFKVPAVIDDELSGLAEFVIATIE
jgi:hypothetical protein